MYQKKLVNLIVLIFFIVVSSIFLLFIQQGITSDENICRLQGGQISMTGECIITTSDAYKSCTDSSQCLSYCVSKDKFATSGTCYNQTPMFGCWYIIEDGQAVRKICKVN